MSLLRNAWYCAAWAREVSDRPLSRTILGEKVVLYRGVEGQAIALGNVCPHRFALLHLGKQHGDSIACPYHGLRFGPDGACTYNPHGTVIPPALKVKSFPLVERDAILWIWTGDPAVADPDLIPEFPAHVDKGFVTVSGVIHIKGGYQLVTDNLLDLSHTQFLHPILVLEEDPAVTIENDIVQESTRITTVYNQRNTRPFGFVRLVWPDAPERIDAFSGVRWDPPANMQLKVHFVSVDPARCEQRMMWGAHLVTPETEVTCHYFWSSARDFRLEDTSFSEVVAKAIESVFTNEDGVMIGIVQQNMGVETDLLRVKPVILPTDKAAVRARYVLRRCIAAQQEAITANSEAGAPP